MCYNCNVLRAQWNSSVGVFLSTLKTWLQNIFVVPLWEEILFSDWNNKKSEGRMFRNKRAGSWRIGIAIVLVAIGLLELMHIRPM